jgi:hypothetical protein
MTIFVIDEQDHVRAFAAAEVAPHQAASFQTLEELVRLIGS